MKTEFNTIAFLIILAIVVWLFGIHVGGHGERMSWCDQFETRIKYDECMVQGYEYLKKGVE